MIFLFYGSSLLSWIQEFLSPNVSLDSIFKRLPFRIKMLKTSEKVLKEAVIDFKKICKETRNKPGGLNSRNVDCFVPAEKNLFNVCTTLWFSTRPIVPSVIGITLYVLIYIFSVNNEN